MDDQGKGNSGSQVTINILVPALLIQATRINVTSRPIEGPKKTFFALSDARLLWISFFEISDASKPGSLRWAGHMRL
jgi:hypothetical protein